MMVKSTPPIEHEREMMELAKRLQFQLEKHASGYSLRRAADVSAPVETENLTLQEVEEFLNTWKLRGFHGG
jgi:hypothetical protein